eukprot:9019400-Alexandrium_andersonii.AAC.1
MNEGRSRTGTAFTDRASHTLALLELADESLAEGGARQGGRPELSARQRTQIGAPTRARPLWLSL